ncbi:hypothetical protein [Pontibacter actiniarum]|uniref:Uncharacterized protein n=1 Tax=Pontibacter actiniarum TaxID=323450 RepID=A0A1X9YYQ5_9BACT|nr:hypothetical protein [Pontibacter actiniarum]ARS38100.1 hypothetical protein CA264_21375 [Pontibacter actiniarum]
MDNMIDDNEFQGFNSEEPQHNSLEFDADILAILSEAHSSNTPQLDLPLPVFKSKSNEEGDLNLDDTVDPEKAHTLYHKKLQRMLRQYVVADGAKQLIREQVNIFLKEGFTKGRDGKQAYYHSVEKAISVIEDWKVNTEGGDMVGLFEKFYDLNIEKGYISKTKNKYLK